MLSKYNGLIFNLNITIVKEENKILDTGGGVLNAIQYFSDYPNCIVL